jgi:hypothetical protein
MRWAAECESKGAGSAFESEEMDDVVMSSLFAEMIVAVALPVLYEVLDCGLLAYRSTFAC